MDPGKITSGVLAILLPVSALCFALRYSADQRRSEAAAATTRTSALAPLAATTPSRTGLARLRDQPLLGSREQVRAALRHQLGEICSQGNAVIRTSALLALTDRLNQTDFPELMAALLDLGIQSYGDDQRLLISVWAELDPGAALAWENANPVPGRESVVLGVWSQRDPAGALSWLEIHRSGSEANLDAMGKLLRNWSSRDARAALSWLESHPEADPKHQLLQFALSGLPGSNLDLIGEMLPRLPEDIRRYLPQILSEALVRATAAERERCLQSLPDSQRIATVSAMINAMRDAPTAGKLELLRQYPAAMDGVAAGPFYDKWVGEDATAALAELQRMPAGPQRKAAIFGAVEGLSHYGGNARLALQLINDHPDEAGEEVLARWVMCAGPNHHEFLLAIDQLPRLSTPQAREQGLRETLESWFFNDAPAAREWMKTHEVPPAVAKAMEKY
ncbi:MAG: hypothetical protein JWO82_737 [Akkermansiaceae bacterium]|nr:hypothetical protein [Akkermansiaceae bacterium]